MPKIDYGFGQIFEADDRTKVTKHHRQITAVKPIPRTMSGYSITMDCGHEAMVFGRVEDLHGIALCLQCRDAEDRAK